MAKKTYVKPTIVKQTVGVMNKFGNTYYRSYCSKIDGVTVDALAAQFGSPLFVISRRFLRAQYGELYRAFSTRYPHVQFAWSYKTNYLGAVCTVFHQEGALAEVVSGFEYEKALHSGVKGPDIIFNGPFKMIEDLKRAFMQGSMVNIDNVDEIYKAEKAAASLNRKVSVGIRVNMDTGIYPQWYKFGFNIENGQALEAVNRITRSAHLKLNGLHAHIGTFILDYNAYALETEKMVRFMQDIESKFSITFDYINIGGGFPSKNRLKGIYLPPDVVVPNLEEYADAVCTALLKFLQPKEFPKLFLETGRALVDEAGYCISTVLAQKHLPDGKKSYFIDAGIHLLPTLTWYNLDIQPDRQLNGIPEQCTLFGPLCMNIDVVADSIYLPPMPTGSRVVLHPVGAYNLTQWMQFIAFRPAVVMIMEDQTVECIRRAETLQDIVNLEHIPPSTPRGQ